jgi:hypothetical protein
MSQGLVNGLQLFLQIGIVFGLLAGIIAFVITWSEWQRHRFTKKRLFLESFLVGMLAFVIFLVLSLISGFLLIYFGVSH